MTAPVPVRDAATVVLLRDGSDGVEVWLLTRVTGMAFAAGMSVFPGGRVDDGDADLPFIGPVQEIARRFACDERLARALLGAAVRETFEEAGVLLTEPPSELFDAHGDVEAGRVGFGELLRLHGLAIPVDALLPWSRWITPAGEVRRYDTRFFVGALPDGAQARDLTTESSSAGWMRVGAALDEMRNGARMLLPPTAMTLAAIAPFGSVTEVLAAAAERRLEPVRPHIRVEDDGTVLAEMPDGTTLPMPRSAVQGGTEPGVRSEQ